MPRMTNLLHQIDAGNRLPPDDLRWLSTEAKEHFAEPLREAYYLLEAEFHADQYRRTGDPWCVINASGDYRKCRRAEAALELLDSLAPNRLGYPKVRSAALTTHGGVLRDLNRRPEAIQMGEKAHSLMPRDYRPCTLLGAVHMEQREFERANAWYEKARARGAPEHSIDSELRSIFQRLDLDGREAMKRFLLATDPYRYRWLNDVPRSRKA
jgi:tetratricopeptide (TPR) repeat protein